VFRILSVVSHLLFVGSRSCLLPCCFVFLACNCFALLPIASCLLFHIPHLLFCTSCLTYLLPLPPPCCFSTYCFMLCCLLIALCVNYYFLRPFHVFRWRNLEHQTFLVLISFFLFFFSSILYLFFLMFYLCFVFFFHHFWFLFLLFVSNFYI